MNSKLSNGAVCVDAEEMLLSRNFVFILHRRIAARELVNVLFIYHFYLSVLFAVEIRPLLPSSGKSYTYWSAVYLVQEFFSWLKTGWQCGRNIFEHAKYTFTYKMTTRIPAFTGSSRKAVKSKYISIMHVLGVARRLKNTTGMRSDPCAKRDVIVQSNPQSLRNWSCPKYLS